jgi:hypothetical protein
MSNEIRHIIRETTPLEKVPQPEVRLEVRFGLRVTQLCLEHSCVWIFPPDFILLDANLLVIAACTLFPSDVTRNIRVPLVVTDILKLMRRLPLTFDANTLDALL